MKLYHFVLAISALSAPAAADVERYLKMTHLRERRPLCSLQSLAI
jgi:hypothetical protein